MANNFQTGQILTATQLNNAFANTVPITGGRMTGDLSLPNIKPDNPVDIAHGGTGANDPVAAANNLEFQLENGVPRPLPDKLADTISITDFGAKGDNGVTDNLIPLTNAFAKANGRTILVPMDKYGGNYKVTSGTLTIPANASIMYDNRAKILPNDGVNNIIDNGRHWHLFGGKRESVDWNWNTKTEGMSIALNSPITGTAAAPTYMINNIMIKDDRIDALSDGVYGTKVDGLMLQHCFGGAGSKGGRHAAEFVLYHNDVTDADNTDNNYVGVAGVVSAFKGDGGTASNPRGEYFGFNSYVVVQNSPYVNHLNGCESNVFILDDVSTVKYRCGYSAVSGGIKQATDYDCGYAIGALGTTGAMWKYGIMAGGQNGRRPISNAFLRVNETGAAGATVLSCGGQIPPNLITSDTDGSFMFRVDALNMFYPNTAIKIGSQTTSNTPSVEFYTGNPNSAGRLLAVGGSNTFATGNLYCQFSSLVTQFVMPDGDNIRTLGVAGQRWSTIYAATGTINTSDERLKTNWTEIEEAEKRAALKIKSVIKRYQFKDSVDEKGNKARYHFGVGAQTVAKIMADEGLDPTGYAFYCYDEWQAQSEVQDGDGNVIQSATEAGNRYGIRYDELTMFILASI